MKCSNPDVCSVKSDAHQERQEKFLSKAQILLEEFQEDLMRGVSEYELMNHALHRERERCFSTRDVNEAMRYGWVIEVKNLKQTREWHLLIIHHLKLGPKMYRPVHIACYFNEKARNQWRVKTVYDPRTMSWKWSEDYEKRICFC